MKKPVESKLGAAIRAETRPRTLIPVLLAAGGSLAVAPATALELGEARVSSTLGQPLAATVAYALGPNEQIDQSCVRLDAGAAASGLPAVLRADITVANGLISIAGQSIAREPLMSMRLSVTCPYTPKLIRDYMLFIDPSQPTVANTANVTVRPETTAASTAGTATPASAPTPAPVARRPAADRPPIAGSGNYRVQPGDSLSLIAQRIENRPVGLWDAVAAIFDANPDAFIGNDPNKLKAGSLIVIPDFGSAQAGVQTTDIFPPAESAPAEPVTAAPATTYEPADVSATPGTSAPDVTGISLPTEPAETAPAEPVETPSTADMANLQPGDIIRDSETSFVTGEETITIPDTELDGPEIEAASPNVPVASMTTRTQESESGSWIGWLLGGAVAVIGGLLLLGRRSRGTFGSTPVGPVVAPQRRKTDGETERLEAVSPVETSIADDDPTSENLALDADLVMGTGLSQGAEVDFAQDFGFAATTDIDFELPEELSSGGVSEASETDVIPPLNSEIESILESEVLPDEDDEYDMSVIVDATKMPQPEDVTERDLEAIEITDIEEALDDGSYTVSQEVDFDMLQKDYEDEFSATQALNQEIARAAEELARDLDDNSDAAEASDEDTSEMSMASITAIDVTAQLPANDEEDADALEDTGINESMTVHLVRDDAASDAGSDDRTVEMEGEEKTINMEADDKTVEMQGDDKTVEMPAGDADETAEMPVKRGSGSA